MDNEQATVMLEQKIATLETALLEFRARALSDLEKQARRIERLEKTKSRQGVAPEDIFVKRGIT